MLKKRIFENGIEVRHTGIFLLLDNYVIITFEYKNIIERDKTVTINLLGGIILSLVYA